VTRRLLILLAALALLAAGCGGADDPRDRGADSEDPQEQSEAAAASDRTETVERTTRVEVVRRSGEDEGFDPEAIFRRDGPGVVTIISVFGEGRGDNPLGGQGPQGGVGSGFVLNAEGEIATNAHVVTEGEGRGIKRAREVYVKFADDNQVRARIVGFDPNADVALLRIEDRAGLTLRPIPLGSSDDVRVGAPVAAIGSPFGEEQSLSIGVVSATDRAIDSLTGFQTLGAVQTDAAINQGNSGGPLINSQGQVIGINAQIRTRSGGGEGVGYAIPVDQVKRSIRQIRDGGEVRYAYLGVSTTAVYPQLAERFDLGTREGAWVQEVVEGGPAADAGIRAGRGDDVRFQARPFKNGGDVITKVADTSIRTDNDLGLSLAPYRPGQKVQVEIVRGGQRQTIEVTLGERPAQVARNG
jgi:S1-C subfamily serine protease